MEVARRTVSTAKRRVSVQTGYSWIKTLIACKSRNAYVTKKDLVLYRFVASNIFRAMFDNVYILWLRP